MQMSKDLHEETCKFTNMRMYSYVAINTIYIFKHVSVCIYIYDRVSSSTSRLLID